MQVTVDGRHYGGDGTRPLCSKRHLIFLYILSRLDRFYMHRSILIWIRLMVCSLGTICRRVSPKGRRAGLIKALTTDVEEFYNQCDPEKENLCLYGYPSEQWEVNLPAEEVPPELPEPVLGINFARDGMQEKDWLSLVAVHSDSWLLAISFYFGARFGFDRADRKRLFNMINELPTIFEVVTGTAKKQLQEKSSGSNHGGNKSKSNSKVRGSESVGKHSKAMQSRDEEEELDEVDEEDEHGETLCGACGEHYGTDEFWICCDICEKWFHGKCVKITPARAEHIKQYKCPSCSNKRTRP